MLPSSGNGERRNLWLRNQFIFDLNRNHLPHYGRLYSQVKEGSWAMSINGFRLTWIVSTPQWRVWQHKGDIPTISGLLSINCSTAIILADTTPNKDKPNKRCESMKCVLVCVCAARVNQPLGFHPQNQSYYLIPSQGFYQENTAVAGRVSPLAPHYLAKTNILSLPTPLIHYAPHPPPYDGVWIHQFFAGTNNPPVIINITTISPFHSRAHQASIRNSELSLSFGLNSQVLSFTLMRSQKVWIIVSYRSRDVWPVLILLYWIT